MEQCREFESDLYKYIETMNRGVLKAIAEKKVLDDGIKADLTKLIKECKEKFVAERQAVAAASTKA